jgi:hypothetical protein
MKCDAYNSSSSICKQSGNKRTNGRERDITGGDVTPTGRTIQPMIKQVCRFLIEEDGLSCNFILENTGHHDCGCISHVFLSYADITINDSTFFDPLTKAREQETSSLD